MPSERKLANWNFSVLQGVPNQNLGFHIAVTLERSILDPLLVKPKCVLGVADFFSFQLFVYNFQLFVYNFPKKSATLQTHFGLYNTGSNVHSF